MRRFATAILLASLLGTSGCSTARGAGQVGTVTGLAIIGLGLMMQANAFGHGGETDPSDYTAIPYTLGPLIAIPSLLMWIDSKDPDAEPKHAPPPPPDPRAANREKAWQLTKQAETAARTDDCATVTQLDGEVRGLDADLHAVVFVRDVAIARCLTPARK